MTHPKLQYIGTKIICAVAMTRGEWCALRGWTVPADEDGADAGYLVEYQEGGKPNVVGYAGYVSWSPKDVFEASYRNTQGLDFGLALSAMKKGFRVARKGWNGKGMWIGISPGSLALPAERFWNPNNRAFAMSQPGQTANVLPCITMKTADDNILMGWLASQSDMLADDWMVLPPQEVAAENLTE